LCNFNRHLRCGERATILCLACNRSQAGIVFGYIKGNFEIPLLARCWSSASPVATATGRFPEMRQNAADYIV